MEKRSFSYKYYMQNPHKIEESVPFLLVQRMLFHFALGSENLPSHFFFFGGFITVSCVQDAFCVLSSVPQKAKYSIST